MKWLLYILILVYMFYKTVYGYKSGQKESRSITIEPVKYGPERNYYPVGVRKTITCKADHRNQKVQWVDPSGNTVPRTASNRVFSKEQFVSVFRTRVPATVLIFTHTAVEDTGEWVCRSGEVRKNVSICVIDPSEFVGTKSEVTADRGRSITLSCQARGNPEPRLVWYRNGEILTDDVNQTKYKVMTKYNSQGFEGLLTIVSLDSEDSGIYTCNAVQESNEIENCGAGASINITLNVNHAPEFENGRVWVATSGNESIDLVCTANGYPIPKYKWYEELGDDLSEYSKDNIQLRDDGATAVLNVHVNASNFGQRYRCHATNEYGESMKIFSVGHMDSPAKPDEISTINSTQDSLLLHVKWFGEVLFPVDGVHIQYLDLKSFNEMEESSDNIWKNSHESEHTNDTFVFFLKSEERADLVVTLTNLSEETEYRIRLRAYNSAGESPWSEPVLGLTAGESDDATEVEDTEPNTVADIYSNDIFYGIFFTAGIIILAVGCMFAMRYV